MSDVINDVFEPDGYAWQKVFDAEAEINDPRGGPASTNASRVADCQEARRIRATCTGGKRSGNPLALHFNDIDVRGFISRRIPSPVDVPGLMKFPYSAAGVQDDVFIRNNRRSFKELSGDSHRYEVADFI
jgi:hypothetical protein